MRTFLIIENFKHGKLTEIYIRLNEKGRMIPEGVIYVDSWVEENLLICYQVMKCESISKIYEWIANWGDLVDFEIVPVISSEEANQLSQQRL